MATTNTTSTSYSYLSTSNNRMSGLASGMDIDGLVEKLMKAESAKMERLQQQKQKYEWQREAYRSVNTKLESFRTDMFDKYGLTSSIISNKVSNSNENKIAATATSTASGSLTISKATLAEGAHDVKGLANTTNKTTVSSIFGGTTPTPNADGSFTETIKVYQQDGSSKNIELNYTIDDTLETIAQKINSQNAGLTAIVGNDGQFSLTATATGKFNNTTEVPAPSPLIQGTIEFGSSNGIFAKLGFDPAIDGKDAVYKVNGVEKTSKSNTIAISGYSLTLKNKIEDGESVSISSTLDSDSVVDKVKSFVELYNGLIKDLSTQVTTKKNLDYSPLTDAQKSEMPKEDIEKWEEKAKAGIIKGDTTITSVLSKMRSALSNIQVDDGNGNKLSIFSIGIDTNTDGTLTIKDETKLKTAVESNPQGVAKLFTQASSTGTSNGIVENLRTAAKSAIDTITTKAGKENALDTTYTLGHTITDIEKQITAWKDRLKDIESRYYSQFTAMEDAINKANSQSSLFSM